MNLIGFLIAALILLVVIYVVKLVMDQIPLPDPIKTIAWLIIGLVFLLILLNQLGVGTNLLR